MKIKGWDHLALNAKNYDATIEFYEKIVGLEKLNSVVRDEFVATYMGIPGGTRLEIFDLKGCARDAEKTDDDVGFKHFAFEVDDVKAYADMVTKAGIEIVMEYSELDDFNAKAVLFKDPDGNTVEFCAPLR